MESTEGDSKLISVAGELERATMLEFIDVCTEPTDESIIIDLGGVTFMDAGGYSSLVLIRQVVQASQRTVTLRNVSGQPARLIGMIGDLEAAQAGARAQADQQPVSADAAAEDEAASNEDAERRLSDLLAEFAQTMTDFPVQAILDHLVERIVEVLPIDSAGVTAHLPGTRSHYVAASDDRALRYERLQHELEEGPCAVASTDGTAILAPDLRQDGQFPSFSRRALAGGLEAVFAFPLYHGNRRLGALNLYRTSPGALDARQIDAAQTLANVAAAYVINAEARADLVTSTQRAQHLALHDPLTGLPNRALLFERLVDAMHRCRRTGSLVAIMFIDLDDFKMANDTFGHRTGDEVLMLVAQRLSQMLRPGDTVARIGGDEFAVLCSDVADVSHLEPIADRVNDAFRLPFDVSIGPVAMRASIGIGVGDSTSTSPERILEEADLAMYQAKRRGGGGHVLYGGRRHTADLTSA